MTILSLANLEDEIRVIKIGTVTALKRLGNERQRNFLKRWGPKIKSVTKVSKLQINFDCVMFEIRLFFH